MKKILKKLLVKMIASDSFYKIVAALLCFALEIAFLGLLIKTLIF